MHSWPVSAGVRFPFGMSLIDLCHVAGGAFSRPNLVFNTAQPQLQISTNPPAAAMPSTLWPQRFPGSSPPQGNMYMPSIPEPDQAAPPPAQNGMSQVATKMSRTWTPAACWLALQIRTLMGLGCEPFHCLSSRLALACCAVCLEQCAGHDE